MREREREREMFLVLQHGLSDRCAASAIPEVHSDAPFARFQTSDCAKIFASLSSGLRSRERGL